MFIEILLNGIVVKFYIHAVKKEIVIDFILSNSYLPFGIHNCYTLVKMALSRISLSM